MVTYCSYDHIALVQLLENNVIFLEQITRKKNKETQGKVLLLITTSFSIQNHAGNTLFTVIIRVEDLTDWFLHFASVMAAGWASTNNKPKTSATLQPTV